LRNVKIRHDFRPDVKAFWPEFRGEWHDETGLDADQRAAKHDDRNRVHIQPTAHQISLMDEAIQWPLMLKSDEKLRLALAVWLKAKAMPGATKSIRKLVEAQGWSKTTFYRHRETALQRIADNLNRGRVRCR
jgi:hypothetical protein